MTAISARTLLVAPGRHGAYPTIGDALGNAPDGGVIADGSVPIRDLNRAMDWDLPDEEATTIAGLVIHEARAIPDAGQVFNFHGFRFQVLRKSRNRITALRVMPLAPRTSTEKLAASAEPGAG